MNIFQSIKISLAYESDINPRRKDFFDSPKFKDFVASVKEKGVLVPVIARIKPKGDKKFEVVVGRCRLRAAILTRKEKIRAEIRELTDDEVREIQIIENLQRSDIHPLDEGFSFRQLIEKSKYSVENIAIKMGKPQGYIRQRLFLTNLNEKATDFYRKGKMTDGHAVLIAKLSPNDQTKAMKELRDAWDLPSVKDFKEWIEQNFYHQLAFQPWLKDEKANQAVGKCIKCSPNKSSLFGDVKEGACTDLECWKWKMKKYIEHKVAVASHEGNKLLKVSKEYGSAGPGILGAGDYKSVSFKKKEQCEYVQKAIIAVGPDVGTPLWVCVSSKCPKHHQEHSDYSRSPKEKEQRRKEAKKEKAKREKEEERIVEALNKVKWPPDEKTLDVIFEMTLQEQGTTVLRPVAKRFGLTPKKKTKYNYSYYDWEGSIKEAAKKMDNAEKLRFIIGVLLERTWGDLKNKILKKL